MTLFLLLLAVTLVILVRVQREPILVRLDPSEANPGDIVAVVGRYLGTEGRLSLDGLGLPADSIRNWSANVIMFVVPDDRSSGNVVVQTEAGTSGSLFLTVETDLPRVVSGAVAAAIVDEDMEGAVNRDAYPGNILVLRGSGFGPPVGISSILFLSPSRERRVFVGDPFISLWTENEIRVAVPDGGEWVSLTVEPYGFSPATVRLVSPLPVINREYGELLRFALTLSVAVEPTNGDVTVVFPKLPITDLQTDVQTLRPSSHRWHEARGGFWNVVVSPVPGDQGAESGASFLERSEMVARRSVVYTLTDDLPDADARKDPDFRRAFAELLGTADGLFPSSKRVAEMIDVSGVEEISSPIEQLLKIEQLVIDEFDPDPDGPRVGETTSSYEYASLFVSVARNLGIPARRIAGLIVLDTGVARVHYWNECFVVGIGWVPFDTAIKDGMYAEALTSIDSFYRDSDALFGIDGRRVEIDADGPPIADLYPGVKAVFPIEPYTIRSQRVEHDAGIDVSVRWNRPQYLGQY